MARTRTAEEMVADVRKRADMENSEFVTDDEILEYLNQERAELAAQIRLSEGQVHSRSSGTIPVVSGTSLYTFSANGMTDFWELLSVEADIGGIKRQLEPFMESERSRLTNAQLYAYSASPRYRIMGGDTIEFLPATQAYTVTIYYAPFTPRLKLGQVPADKMDGFNGYEMACIYGATATCLAKEETDPSYYLTLKDRIVTLIKALAAQRDASHPERVTDVVGLDSVMPDFLWR